MAITNVTPALTDFNPVYNTLTYGFDSDNKALPGFRYVVDVYEAGTAIKIYEDRIAPRPGDGYGYIDLSKQLSSYVTSDLDLTSTTNIDAVNSYYEYDIKIGEEYQLTWEFDDTFFETGDRVRISSTASQTFLAGDQVVVTQDNPTFIPNLQGLQTVFEVVDVNNIVIDIPFVSSAANTGFVKYADNRKTTFRDLLELDDRIIFNAAFSSKDWINYSSTLYKIQSASADNLMLTDLPDDFYATLTQDLFVNVALTDTTDAITIKFENSNGDILSKTTNTNGTYIKQYAVGPNNYGTLGVVSGTLPLIKTDTDWYEFWISDDGGSQMTKKYRINLDRRCKIETNELLFLDRKGSYISYAFQLIADQTFDIERFTYKQQIGDIVGEKWTYTNTERGTVDYDINESASYQMNSNTMTWEMARYYVQLLTSPDVYVKIDGEYYSCNVQDKNYKLPSVTNKRKKHRQRINIKLANQNNINV